MVRKIVRGIIAIVLLVGIVGGLAAWLTVNLVAHPLASFEREDISILLITHYESDEQGVVRPRVVDFQPQTQQAAEVSELLQEQQYRRNFTFKRCYPEISVSVLLGEGDEQMLYTVDIACDGTVQVNETRGALIGGEEAAAKLIAALLPYLSAASEPIDR